MRILLICIFQLFSLSLFSLSRPVTLPRVTSALVEKEVLAYKQRKHQENVELFVKRGALLGAVALGVVVVGGVGYVMQGLAKEKRDESSSQNKESGHLEMFKRAMILAVGGGIGMGCLHFSWTMAFSLIDKLWEKNDTTFVHLFPLAKRIEHSLNRLYFSMEELCKYSEGTFLFNHYYSEVEDAFSLLIRSLEKFCGILSYELKTIYGTDDVALQDVTKSIEKLYFFSGQLACDIEKDLNSPQWTGFRKETFDMQQGFDSGFHSLLPKPEAVN